MSEISSFDLSRRIAGASPQPAHAELAKNAFMAKEGEDLSNDMKGLSRILSRAKEAAGEGVSASAIVYAGAFLTAGTSEEDRAQISEDVAARHVLALSSVDASVEGADLKSAVRAGGFPADMQNDVARAIYDGKGISDDAVRSLSGAAPVFSTPSPEDEHFASSVLSSSRASLAGDAPALRASLAVEALDVDPEGPDAERLASSLSRVSADPEGRAATVPDLAVRLASDVAAQARAARLVDIDSETRDPAETRIRDALLADESLAHEIELESKGLFHEMTRGAAMDLRSDMSTGANLPQEMVRLIRLSAERIAEREGVPEVGAETTGELLSGREGLDEGERREQVDHMPGQMPSHAMEM